MTIWAHKGTAIFAGSAKEDAVSYIKSMGLTHDDVRLLRYTDDNIKQEAMREGFMVVAKRDLQR